MFFLALGLKLFLSSLLSVWQLQRFIKQGNDFAEFLKTYHQQEEDVGDQDGAGDKKGAKLKLFKGELGG